MDPQQFISTTTAFETGDSDRQGHRRTGRSLTATQQRHHIDAATGYLMLGMTSQARRELAAFPQASTDLVHCLRGQAYCDETLYPDALAEFRTALEINPANLNAAVGAAWCLKRTDRLDAAIETLRDASMCHPREALIQYNLACYFALLEDRPRCLSHLGVALRLDSNYVELIEAEADFDSIRDDEAFRRLIETVRMVA